MAKRFLLLLPIAVGFLFLGGRVTGAQDDTTNIRVNVDLVQLNVAVTDSKGNYISGLGPENFAITEDKIPERIATSKKATSLLDRYFSRRECGSWQTGRAQQPPAGKAKTGPGGCAAGESPCRWHR